jgi:hypothetical protein
MAIFGNRFSYAIRSMFGSMCAHRFLKWKYSTHNLKYIILTIRLLLRQPGVGSTVVCFSKDVKVPVKVKRTLSSVGTSSSNIYFKLASSKIKDDSS